MYAKTERHARNYRFAERKVQPISSIVACDLIALRSRRKDLFKAFYLLGFFRGSKRVYVSFFHLGNKTY